MGEAAAAPDDPARRTATDPGNDSGIGDEPTTTARRSTPASAGERASAWPAVMLGVACALIWMAAWLLGKLWRKWPAYLVGLPIFLVVLFFFFENFSRLLPANF